jgi:hypothetical protein
VLLSVWKFCVSDFLNLLLESKTVERVDPQVRENPDAILELAINSEKEPAFLIVSSFKRRRIGDSPMRGDRLARPHRTLLGCRLVANREDEIDARVVGGGELVPALGSKALVS